MSEGFNKEAFVGVAQGKMTDKYEILNQIGEGGYARCLKVKNKITGTEYACKELRKKKLTNLEGLKTEINFMIKLDHPNIVRLYEVFEDDNFLFLILELCCGGEMFDRIVENTEKNEPFTEAEAAKIFQQMMEAINYCHKNGIVHRDLKPENLLYLGKERDSPIKVIDFGMSKKFDEKKPMKERVGTAYYISPEVLKGKYDEKCDIWSAGVILYILICGYPCFNGDDDDEIFQAILKGKVVFPPPEWDNISEGCKKLVLKMLSPPDKRPSAEQVLEDPWIKDHAPDSKNAQLPLKAEGFKNYANSNKLRKAILTYIASHLSEKEIKDIKACFQAIDKNSDGKLSLEEMKNAIAAGGLKGLDHIEEIFKSIDTDNSGHIEYTEFISACLEKSVYLNEAKLKDAFGLFDIDKSGKISKAEIVKVLGLSKVTEEINKIVEKYDLNKDGEIDFAEFMNLMNDIN